MASAVNLDSHMVDSEKNVPTAPRMPWEFHPALTEERLRICGRLLANARRDAVAMAAYEMGDDSWSVGCRAYAFGKQRLKRAASSRVHSWLSVIGQNRRNALNLTVTGRTGNGRNNFSKRAWAFGVSTIHFGREAA